MFKLVFVFGLMVASAPGQDTSDVKLSRHSDLSQPSNRTNQTITESFGNPIIDSIKAQNGRTQPGTDPFTWFSKCSLTNHSCPPPVERPLTKAPHKNDDMSVSTSADRKSEKMAEVETPRSNGRREATIPRSNSELSLLDDWTEDKVKVSHISHIYIGEPLYPYIYEESRVFQTEAQNPSSGESSPLKEVKISETRHKKDEEVRVHEITKIHEIK